MGKQQNNWSMEEDIDADLYVESPDGHRFYYGNMEGIGKCCFDNARFIVEACNMYMDVINKLHKELDDLIAKLKKEENVKK